MSDIDYLLKAIAERRWKNGYLTILVKDFLETGVLQRELIEKPKEKR